MNARQRLEVSQFIKEVERLDAADKERIREIKQQA